MINGVVKISGYSEPTRLDRVLREQYKGLSQGAIEKALRNGRIKVNGKKAEAKLRITDNDEVSFHKFQYEETTLAHKSVTAEAITLSQKLLNEYKIFENEQILVINKPAGVAVQGGTKIRLSVDDALKYLNENGGEYKITHRLDKETSGLLLIAKGKAAAQYIYKGFKERIIKKQYLAILAGIPKEKAGQIVSNISKVDSKHYQKVVENDLEGKIAITDYQVQKSLGNFALTQFFPHTGRMHQIRVHAASLGCPIIGDTKYGTTSQPYKNLFLHAYTLTLPLEILGREYEFKAPTPEYWGKFLG
ncbi:MAG: rluA1 [Rickettsiaceae bacterium]|jgi:23S rRNA pseudouridine955/2504/2580 synthase|nr:rluA1 [Rickettsiaceae bacterium]